MILEYSTVQRWGHSLSLLENTENIECLENECIYDHLSLVVVCGAERRLGGGRCNSVLISSYMRLDSDNFDVKWRELSCEDSCAPCPRVHQGMTKIHLNGIQVFVVSGGRTNPQNALGDLYFLSINYNSSSCSWEKVLVSTGNSPSPRWRHSLSSWNKNRVLVFGGKSEAKSALADLFCFHAETRAWEELILTGEVPSSRHSHAAAVVNDSLFIHGGILEDGSLDSSFFEINLNSGISKRVAIPSGKPIFSHSLLAHGSLLYIFGGFSSPDGIAANWGASFDTSSRTWEDILVSGNSSDSPLLLRHGAVILNGKRGSSPIFALIGGGAVCFSFGSFFSPECLIAVDNESFMIKKRELEGFDDPSDAMPKGAGIHTCKTCQNSFGSRNQLFKHIRALGHKF